MYSLYTGKAFLSQNYWFHVISALYKPDTSLRRKVAWTVSVLHYIALHCIALHYITLHTLRDKAYLIFTHATSKVTSARNRTISYRACANFTTQNVTSFSRAMRHFLLLGGNSLLLLFCRKAVVQTTISITPAFSNINTHTKKRKKKKEKAAIKVLLLSAEL